MREPLYKVGEEVYLVSISYPECNGEGVILEITQGDVYTKDAKTGEGFIYRLSIDTPNGMFGWSECALRKKYPPSKLSFNELIKECKSNVVY